MNLGLEILVVHVPELGQKWGLSRQFNKNCTKFN
jgi:hypothetical protein